MFRSPTKGLMTFEEMVDDIASFVHEAPDHEYNIMIGSDSQKGRTVKYVVSIIIHRKGKGARYFYLVRIGNNKVSFQERIISETVYAIEVANMLQEALRPILKDTVVPIHADIGNKGRTRELIKTITGMILASGFEPVIKPEGIAACSVADKHSKF